MWLDREGQPAGSIPKPDGYERPALSPDGKVIAAEQIDPQTRTPDIWLIDTTRGVSWPLTANPAAERLAVWSPDGTRVAYSSRRGRNPPNIFQMMSNGTGSEELLLKSDVVVQPTDWSRDGRFIIYAALDPQTQWDLWYVAVTPGGERAPVRYAVSPFNEHHGRLSPDGRWMAYVSDDSKRWQVSVCGFPECGARTLVSTDGGVEPRWGRDGRELFYVAPGGALMAAAVQSGSTFSAGTPRALFRHRFAGLNDEMWRPEYVPGADAQRFLVNGLVDERPLSPVTVVLNWTAGLRR